jgi:hypothetical protein
MQIPLRVGALAGFALHSDAVTLSFSVPKAFPPGQPLELVLWPDTPDALPLSGRSLGSKLRADQQFEVRARLTNLARASRERLLDVFNPNRAP